MDNAPSSVDILRLGRPAFHAWAEAREGRWERVDGEPVRMSPERRRHGLLKARLWKLLEAAILAQALPFEAVIGSLAVQAGEGSDFIPDVAVHGDPELHLDAVAMTNPVIVAEVTSRSARSIDTTVKLPGYFAVPSILHYLIVSAEQRTVIHHRREGSGIATSIVTSGTVFFDPPGIGFDLAELYAVLPGGAGR